MSQPGDYTPELASDPHTPADVLREIAQQRPDLREFVAQNPAAPADLLTELADAAAPADAETAEATTQLPSIPQPPSETAPLPQVAQDEVPQPPTATLPAAVAVENAGEAQENAPKKSSRVKWIAIAAGALVAVGSAAFALNHFVFSKTGGSETPQAAVEQLVNGLDNKDLVAVYGSLLPSDVDLFTSSSEQFFSHFEGKINQDNYTKAFTDAFDALDITTKNVKYSVKEVNDNYALVSLTSGEFTVDADGEKLANVANGVMADLEKSSIGKLITDAGETFPTEQEIKDEIVSSVDKDFPATFTAEDLQIPVMDEGASAFDSLDSLDTLEGLSGLNDRTDWTEEVLPDAETEKVPFAFVAHKVDGGWFVSPVMTMYDVQAKTVGKELAYAEIPEGKGSAKPEEAAAAWAKTYIDGVGTLNFSDSFQYVIAAERGMGAVSSALPLEGPELAMFEEALKQVQFSDPVFSVDRVEGDLAYLKLDSFEISADMDGTPVAVTLNSECADITSLGMDMSLCIRDIPAAQELGLDQLRLLAKKEDGGWYIASSQTGADSMGVLGSNALRLAEEGHLTDEMWWMDNLGVLGSFLGGPF
ncbi:hypothetical protein [Timonella sp. A28]|uniref:variant leucine-rich repeat-containing protein n=1 Tax=Timonella sp. A28 TaxID=3442640 RepID=UPI003EBD9B18